MKALLLCVIVLFIATIPASNPAARIWNINSAGTGDAATIQAGIDSATTGDTVLLADGTYTGFYNRNIDFKGKAITVRSASGNPNACVIDPQGNNRGFYFHTGESATSVLEYVKITNGNTGSSGGGIACYIASPTITGCIVSSCFANGGGGMYCEEASPTVTSCTFSGNTSNGNGGGLLCMINSSPTLSVCTFSGNSCTSGTRYGGGISCSASSPSINNCLFSNNTSQHGGGIHWSGGSHPTVSYCTFANNSGIQYNYQ